MSWAQYVRQTIGDDKQVDVATRTGIDQTTISRWLKGEIRSISSHSVRRFACGYGVPVVEAFVEAGLLTEDDIKVRSVASRSLSKISTRELTDELLSRADRADVS